MRASLQCGLMASVFVFACNPNSIGRPCVNPGGQAVCGTQVSSPALECPSRLCLLQPQPADGSSCHVVAQSPPDGGTFRATCTAECQNDGDCAAETSQYCTAGFVCAVAVTTGPFCCRKLCICRSDLKEGINVTHDGTTLTPTSCAPGSSSCPNVR